MPLDEARFRQVMGHFASGVTVVTTRAGGDPFGMTVASFASLSLRPQLVLVCIEKGVRTHDAIAAAGRFAVNILGDHQEEVSRVFASRSDEKFSAVATIEGSLGVPLLEGAIASIECTVTAQLPGGDHTIFVGEVADARTSEGEPLLYFRSSYRGLK
jgi:flavin reductase (DIM6/NTAB) family NADH-FMN oxidoreductase RutF